jgi:hypothetical protein
MGSYKSSNNLGLKRLRICRHQFRHLFFGTLRRGGMSIENIEYEIIHCKLAIPYFRCRRDHISRDKTIAS